MALIHVTDPNGVKYEIDAPEGESLMQAMLDAGVEGILADCGGGCSCATCHCYIDEKDMQKVGEVNPMDDSMQDLAASERRDNSRLSCQIDFSVDLTGLQVVVPENG